MTPMFLDSKVLELFSLQLSNAQQQVFTNSPNVLNKRHFEKVYEAKEILLESMHTSPSIQELVLRVGTNETTLKKNFKAVFHKTIFGYLLEYKMNKAQKLLLQNELSITEIAFHCGYEHPSHFSTAFKRYFGISPKKTKL